MHHRNFYPTIVQFMFLGCLCYSGFGSLNYIFLKEERCLIKKKKVISNF